MAQRRPTLTGGDPQLPSAQKSLTAVFGMGTGVASLPSSLDGLVLECLRPQNRICDIAGVVQLVKSSID